ncbi:ABC transporter ATP-binding protein [Consotaella salsifontis]|uniref:Energy-coupling factor transport system ATP-binding protein n=1 Tax=Consotaella salsifontis TaxID=1365950 RepID=A0A1T4QFS9_9HYPH|nr:ATP-binding cassette domain-containing protein [Consotaella salsifontis]SKA02589.1 energy-coupling factor transport system ATP-binding protein [Consotaella salsifontis]
MTSAPLRSPEECPIAEWAGTRVTFPFEPVPAVGPIDLKVRRGECVLLLGASGSGKSSLLLALTGLIPESVPATVAGKTRVAGRPATERRPAEWSDTVAHYFQDADQVLCGMRVEDEIAFALENRALPAAEIEARVGAAMDLLGLPESWRDRRSLSLSGGERQWVALAATLVQDADLFVADEPTAHLAPEIARRLHHILVASKGERTTLIVDHRIGEAITAVDRVVALGRGGHVLAEGEPRRFFRDHGSLLEAEGIWRPAASELDARLIDAGIVLTPPPLTIEEALGQLAASEKVTEVLGAFLAERLPPRRSSAGAVIVRLERADCAPFLGKPVLLGIDLAVRAGEVTVLLGRNGAGKSTLAASLAGLLRLKGGRREGPAGALVVQQAEAQFSQGSVREEIASMLKGTDAAGHAEKTATVLAAYGLSGLESRHPMTLSQGQKRRLAIAAIDAADRWSLVVLDEPTAGLDAAATAGLIERIEALRAKGRAVVVVTHDMDFALRVADRAVVLAEEHVAAEGPAQAILLDGALLARHGLKASAAALVRRWLDGEGPC